MTSPSSSSDNGYTTKTRFPEETQKRNADEELRQYAELKRQNKMFVKRKLIGPRDLLVNSKLPKIKLEEDVGSGSFVKLEPLDPESMAIEPSDQFLNCNVPMINLQVNGSLNMKMEVNQGVELTFTEQFSEQDRPNHYLENLAHEVDIEHEVISEFEQSDNALESSSKQEVDKFCQNHIQQLKLFIGQKDHEINSLFQAIQGLQLKLDASEKIICDVELNNEQIVLVDSNIDKSNVIQGATSDNARVLAKLTSNLMEKHAKVVILSMKMLKLQDKLFGTASFSLEISKNYKTPAEFVQESFEMILPFLYTDLQLNDILACRVVCRSWRNAVEEILNNHESRVSFNKESHVEELRRLEYGRLPSWNESPLQTLAKAYVFSDTKTIQAFKSKSLNGTILGSTVCLDNLILRNELYMNKVTGFLKDFNVHIKYLVICQRVDLPDFKIQVVVNRIKLCLSNLPNLHHFRLVFCIDKDKVERENGWNALEAKGNNTYKNWEPSFFPQLKKLESLELDLDNWEGFTERAHFLQNLSKSLIQPYSEQLKQLSIFTRGVDPSDFGTFPNLVQLSIPQRELGNMELRCQQVEKCTITDFQSMVIADHLSRIKRLFPKLTCLGLKLKYAGEKLYDFENKISSLYEPTFPKLSDVLTLELENCGAVTFNTLECFPNLSYLKLISKHTTKIIKPSNKPILEITHLWKGGNLYESKDFWESFPSISLVTLEYKGDAMNSIKPKLFKWNRKGYANYCCDNFLEEMLQTCNTLF